MFFYLALIKTGSTYCGNPQDPASEDVQVKLLTDMGHCPNPVTAASPRVSP